MYCNFTGYSGVGENTDISQELSPEKSIVTKSNSSNKSSAHPSTLLHCTDSGQHKGKSKANGEMTLLYGFLVLSFITSKYVSNINILENWFLLCKFGYSYSGLCMFPSPCLTRLDPVHLPELDITAFYFDFNIFFKTVTLISEISLFLQVFFSGLLTP